ncbi:MAG: CoA-binding protein [Candidatus Bathyarchaeia archaeon]
MVEQAIQLRRLYDKLYVVWTQLGIVNKHAADMARKAGFTVIMDKCIMREHIKLFSRK